jgi:hypothetical protein
LTEKSQENGKRFHRHANFGRGLNPAITNPSLLEPALDAQHTSTENDFTIILMNETMTQIERILDEIIVAGDSNVKNQKIMNPETTKAAARSDRSGQPTRKVF